MTGPNDTQNEKKGQSGFWGKPINSPSESLEQYEPVEKREYEQAKPEEPEPAEPERYEPAEPEEPGWYEPEEPDGRGSAEPGRYGLGEPAEPERYEQVEHEPEEPGWYEPEEPERYESEESAEDAVQASDGLPSLLHQHATVSEHDEESVVDLDEAQAYGKQDDHAASADELDYAFNIDSEDDLTGEQDDHAASVDELGATNAMEPLPSAELRARSDWQDTRPNLSHMPSSATDSHEAENPHDGKGEEPSPDEAARTQQRTQIEAPPVSYLDPSEIEYDPDDSIDYVNTAHSMGTQEAHESKEKRRRHMALMALALALILLGTYALGVWYFFSHLLLRTSINGFDASGMTTDLALQGLKKETQNYTCTVSVGDFDTTVRGADIGVERDEKIMVAEAMQLQSPFAWPVAFVAPSHLRVHADVSFDEEALSTVVSDAVEAHNEDALSAANIYVEYDEESGLYEVTGTDTVPIVIGDEVAQSVASDVKGFRQNSSPNENACIRVATPTDVPNYLETVNDVNRVLSTDIPILVGGVAVAYAYAGGNTAFVGLGEDSSVTVDEDALREWADYSVANAVYYTDDQYEYYLDVETFVEEFGYRLANGIVDGYEAPIFSMEKPKEEPETSQETGSDSVSGDWDKSMGRYIDVNLSAQYARLFDADGSVIWESAFVSGDVYQGRSTVTGLFSIFDMQTNTTLVGTDEDYDGQPDYESFVYYWMPFYGGYGFHDATWRSDFGGDNYAYDGSHGCINLPYDSAEWLYSLTFVGEQVYIHW